MRKIISICLLIMISVAAFAGVSLKSYEEEYYDFLVLTGRAERNYLTYRTLNTNTYSKVNGFWDIKENSGNLTVYNPDLFISANSARPLGQNDGGLWQGVGVNARLRGGIGYTLGDFSFTFKPELDFSQNAPYDTCNNTNDYFWANKGITRYDLPQRFGDDPVFWFDFGDSDIRFTKGAFSVGVGTQALWLGPTYLNAVIHSNNASTYPRVDIGLNKVAVNIPWTDIPFGEIEGHYSLGILSRSFSEDKSFLHLFVGAWKPAYLNWLTLGVNIAGHTECSAENLLTVYKRVFLDGANLNEDIKLSLTADILLPESGFEFWAEFGWDDNEGNLIKNCYHTMVGQVGFKKSVDLNASKDVYGELVFEAGIMEMSSDGFAEWPYNFYTHGNSPSYTNNGQNLGAGSGYAGNSEYLGFNVFYPQGYSTIYLHRSNPDTNYILHKVHKRNSADRYGTQYYSSFKGIIDLGLTTTYLGFDDFVLSGGLIYEVIFKDHYQLGDSGIKDYMSNFHGQVGLQYKF